MYYYKMPIIFLTGTPDMCDKLLDEALAKIPTSTRKRKLFDNKPPLTDSSNMFIVSIIISTICIQKLIFYFVL